jgi:RNA 2',3'-cyclic 3'-phosphodiesterase
LSGSMLRLFAAVSLPLAVRSALSSMTKQIQAERSFRTLPHMDDLHLTLFFLGDTAPEKLDSVHSALEEAAGSHKPFKLGLGSLGTFGPSKSPSVLWAGLEGETIVLRALHSDVQKALSSIGYKAEERPYQPHITLAKRYNGNLPWSPSAVNPAYDGLDSGMDWICEGITLFKSSLGQSPMYKILGHYHFKVKEDLRI